jgi:hypothetical protein
MLPAYNPTLPNASAFAAARAHLPWRNQASNPFKKEVDYNRIDHKTAPKKLALCFR